MSTESLLPVLPSDPRVLVPMEVYYFDTDAAGVVHNVAYLRMIEVARTQLANSLGWSLEKIHALGTVPVVHRTEIDYLKPIRLGESIVISAELSVLEKVRFHIVFTVYSAKNPKQVFARARQVMITVQTSNGRPQRVFKEWRQAYSGLCVAE